MPRVRHIHSSGRHDRPKRKIRDGLDRYAKRGADVLTLTEYHKKTHRDTLTEWALTHEYEVGQGPGASANCAIAVGPGYHIVKFWHHQLSQHEQRRGPGGPPPPFAATALVEHEASGKQSLWSVAHLPPNVEGDWNARKIAYRVWLWREVNAEWRRFVRRKRKRYKVKAAMVADWNLNFEKAWVRRLMKALYPSMRLTWRKFPGPGTHHKRVIDGTVTNMRVVDPAELLPDDDSSDHRPYDETLAF